MEKDTHEELAAAWIKFIKRVEAIKEVTKKIIIDYADAKPRT